VRADRVLLALALPRDAWKSKESLSKDAAMRAYVATLLQVSTIRVALLQTCLYA
jgi:hypothetical protein